MTQVTVKNGNLDMALRKFKQKVARDGVPSECKKRECYDKHYSCVRIHILYTTHLMSIYYILLVNFSIL